MYEHKGTSKTPAKSNIATGNIPKIQASPSNDIDSIKNKKKHRKQRSTSSCTSFNTSECLDILVLQPLQYEDEEHRQEAFIRKILQCKKVFDFSDPTMFVRQKEIKRATLNDLIDYVSTHSGIFDNKVVKAIFEMVALNLFRVLPPEEADHPEFDPDDCDTVMDTAWPHLQLVYDFFLRVLEASDFDPKYAPKDIIDHRFVVQLISLFNSQDSREREMLKTVLHRIYGRFVSLRPMIRNEINNIFLSYAFEDASFHGISELLEMVGSIISGFTLPLKDEHRRFLLKVLIPLHRPQNIAMYHHYLTICVLQFIEKEPALAIDVIKGILQIWPKTNSTKELHLLGEVEEILENLADHKNVFAQIMEPLFKQLAKCVSSIHFQVAERSLYLWNNETILTFITANISTVLPIMFPALYKVSTEHWNTTIIQLVVCVLKTCMSLNRPLFDKLMDEHATNTAGSSS